MSYNNRVYIFLFVFYMLLILFIMYFSIIDKDYINIYLKKVLQLYFERKLSVFFLKYDCNCLSMWYKLLYNDTVNEKARDINESN